MSADDVGVSKKRRVRAIIVFNVAATLAVLVAIEFGVTFMLNHPDRLSGPLLHFARRYYAVYDRVCVQACSLYARYDKDVTYTLRPGIWRDTAREFSNVYHVNSMGVRDDEESLAAPEIVVLGDSFGMGLGVEQDETFAQQLEKITGKKTLNTAVSSYGTVRELRMLERVDRSKLKLVVIQYCGNDWEENYSSLINTNRLIITEQSAYEEVANKSFAAAQYRFGRHVLRLITGTCELARRALPWVKTGNPPDWPTLDRVDHGRYFLDALVNASVDLSTVQLVVFVMDGHANSYPNPVDLEIADSFRKEMKKEMYPDFVRKMTVLDVTTPLGADCFYRMDGHLNAKGHALVASLVAGCARF